ncbi:MAG TPA: hypothetical protein VFI04_03775 [Gaiellaceae bacterium]|nr:hypothetical protein [Gaiellaceae bacterium]
MKMLKGIAGAVAAVYFAVTGMLLIWGGWLLMTNDPDGGRHPVGGAMAVVSLALRGLWRRFIAAVATFPMTH